MTVRVLSDQSALSLVPGLVKLSSEEKLGPHGMVVSHELSPSVFH